MCFYIFYFLFSRRALPQLFCYKHTVLYGNPHEYCACTIIGNTYTLSSASYSTFHIHMDISFYLFRCFFPNTHLSLCGYTYNIFSILLPIVGNSYEARGGADYHNFLGEFRTFYTPWRPSTNSRFIFPHRKVL